MPEIGHPESYYSEQVRRADKMSNPHAREANKVGQYITLGLDAHLEWEKRLRYFQHALRAHCQPPPMSRDEVWSFYAELANMVRRYCGTEALKLASNQDDLWAAQVKGGMSRERLKNEATLFFHRIMGFREQRPEHFNEEDWEQLRIIRNQWV